VLKEREAGGWLKQFFYVVDAVLVNQEQDYMVVWLNHRIMVCD
jgi:hypothetical protein